MGVGRPLKSRDFRQQRARRVYLKGRLAALDLRERSASTSIASSLIRNSHGCVSCGLAARNRGRNEGERGAPEARVVPQTPWRIGIALRQNLTLGIRRSQAPVGKNKR